MSRRSALIALALSLLTFAPSVAATPLALAGDGRLSYDWSLPGASGRCSGVSATLNIVAQYVNDRLHVTLASDTRSAMDIVWRAPWDPVNAACPMAIAYGGGVVVNPCQTFDTSVPAPASVATDPYFYRIPWADQWFSKEIGFPDGGRAVYYLYLGGYTDLGPTIGPWIAPTTGRPLGNFDMGFHGECSAPSGARAVWSAHTDRAGALVTDPR